MLPEKLTFIDVETTGTSFRKDRVIEIAIIQTVNGKIVSEFESLVNPQQHVPPSILSMTGIDPNELESAPTFRDIVQQIGDLLEDSIFVAHNAAFDYGFIKNEFRLLDLKYSARCLCTVKLSRALYPRYRSHNLDSIINRFGFRCEDRHRALADTKVMVDFMNLIKSEFTEAEIENAINVILKRPSTPINISEEAIDNLPETPGVYIFYSESGTPLYIGKSINIRNRVLSHFSSASLSSTELKIASQVKDIQTITTEGELGALLKESELIKEKQPIYNRKLRNASKLIYLGYEKNSDGYKEVVVSHTPTNEILGVFKTQKQLKETLDKLSEEHSLCKKLLGLEKGKSSCFGYHLGKCKGACVNKENPQLYNLRFDLAFIKTKIRAWPFNSPIVISEGEEKFLVDNWRYKKLDEGSNYIIDDSETFDLDTYKILSRYISSTKNLRRIKSHIK